MESLLFKDDQETGGACGFDGQHDNRRGHAQGSFQLIQMSYLSNSNVVHLPAVKLNPRSIFGIIVFYKMRSRLLRFLDLRERVCLMQALKHQFKETGLPLYQTVLSDFFRDMNIESVSKSREKNACYFSVVETLRSSTIATIWNFPINMLLMDKVFHGAKSLQESMVREDQIRLDLNRTFKNQIQSELFQDPLKEVIEALQRSIPDFQYIQGMNTVVGSVFLAIKHILRTDSRSSEEVVKTITFGTMKYFLEGRGFQDFYSESFQKYKTVCTQLDCLVESLLPELHKHFVSR